VRRHESPGSSGDGRAGRERGSLHPPDLFHQASLPQGALHEHLPAKKINTLAAKRRLPNSQPVVAYEREQRPVPRVCDHAKEAPDLLLREVAGQVLVGVREDGQDGEKEGTRSLATALNSRKAQWVAKAHEMGLFASGGAGSPQAIR
jgi:hypothetical protein